MKLNAQQHEQLLRLLQNDYGFKSSSDEYLMKGVCPACKKRELFISHQQPWQLCCNRRNKCGFTASTYDLYKNELFANWSKHYEPTLNNPNATADAYMQQARGFAMVRVRGLYKQEYYVDKSGGFGTATVRFTLSDGKAQWERFIDDVERFPGQKGRALTPYKGLWWQMPDEPFTSNEVWITEGIFDALSLIHANKTAIACISSGHYPSGFFEHLKRLGRQPRIIIALDSDKAGKEAAQKHYYQTKKTGFDVRVALPPKGKDWNDLWRNGQLTEAVFAESLYQGDLLVAETATEKARIMYRKSGMNTFPFTHAERTYWFSLEMSDYHAAVDEMQDAGIWHDDDKSRDEALKRSGSVAEIANCAFDALYFQRSRDGDESRYFLRISRPKMATIQDTFSGGQISSAADFKKRLLSIYPGALYEGTGKQLDRMIKEKFNHLRTVETIDYCGYVRDLDAWIYRDFAVSNGRVIRANSEQFLEMGRLHSIKTLSDVSITLSDNTCQFDWLDKFWRGFGERGMVALTFFTGTLFVDQIRQKQQSWPFLEMTGEAGTGKTTLLEFLWRLHGRADYEGFDPNKTSFAGRARSFNKVSGLPVVLIEGDHHASHHRKFEFSELKDLFNGRPMYTRAVKTTGMETNDPPFRGSIIIAQNAQIEADEAVLSRIIPLFFTRKNIPQGGKPYVDALNRLSVEDLASYLVHILCRAKKILNAYFDCWSIYDKRLSSNEKIVMTRIAHNGAQIMAMFDVLSKQMKLPQEIVEQTLNFIEEICINRQQSLEADHPMVAEFFDSVDYLESLGNGVHVNHSIDEGLLAINLPHMEAMSKNAGITMPPRTELNRLLTHAKRYKYLGKRSVRSKQLDGKVIKCLIFQIGEKQ